MSINVTIMFTEYDTNDARVVAKKRRKPNVIHSANQVIVYQP